MPAPTALQRKSVQDPETVLQQTIPQSQSQSTSAPSEPIPEDIDIDIEITTSAQPEDIPLPDNSDDSDSSSGMQIDAEGRPHFIPEDESTSIITSTSSTLLTKLSTRKIPIPPHRFSPLKASWPQIYPPLVEHLKLQVRMNLRAKAVELRTSKHTVNPTHSLQRAEDFLHAFTLGFALPDAIALLRLDDLYIETFEVKDVKTLAGEHLGRAIGRIAGKDGKTKFAIENASRTRVVVAGSKVHILGGYQNIGIAREAVVSLILGKPPGKVYGNLRTVQGRMKERF